MSTLDPRDIDMTYPNGSVGTFKIRSPNTTLSETTIAQSYSDEYQNSISFHALGAEMLRCGPDGFYVRGKKIEQDDNEAQIVYNSFKEWLTWQQLNRG
jgi:hypothetical protein